MKTMILAGGAGSRLREETVRRPKPLVEIGQRPILWHIMRHYARFGFREFVVALGYKGDAIKRYFVDQCRLSGELTIDFASGRIDRRPAETPDWAVKLIDTGLDTSTGGRLARLETELGDETFMATYGDGVADVDLAALVDFHRAHGKVATVTAVRPPARFGGLEIDGDAVRRFREKPASGENWINGGFFVFEPSVFDWLSGDDCSLETDVLDVLASRGQLRAYRHTGFWQCMDTLRDKRLLEQLWRAGESPWAVRHHDDTGTSGSRKQTEPPAAA